MHLKLKKTLKKTLKFIGYILLIPSLYLLISLLLTVITVNKDQPQDSIGSVYLNTNGIHLDVVIPIQMMDKQLLYGLKHELTDNYLSFGWGDENFYLNTPEWSDLSLSTAVNAVFLKSPTLVHVTRYRNKQSDWIAVAVSQKQFDALCSYLQETFLLDELGEKNYLRGQGYTARDDFYKARGNYHMFKTCNSWVNNGFKESGLKAALWTPFDFGLMDKYR